MAVRASGDDDIEYREMMARIAKRVDNYTLEELKYQCRDVIGPGKLEKVSTAQNLFETLEERDEINADEVDFLYKILKNVDRIDLCKVVSNYLSTRENSSKEPSAGTPSSLHHNPTAHKTGVPYNTVPPKSFIRHGTDTKPQNVSKASYQATSQGENYSTPFDTSNDPGGGFFIPAGPHPQVSNQHASTSPGHAIPPELSTGLEFVISSISRGWQSAARNLGVPDVVIDHAEDNWPRNIRNQIGEAFRYWARNDRNASLQKLIQAMRRIGRNDIADDLQYGQ